MLRYDELTMKTNGTTRTLLALLRVGLGLFFVINFFFKLNPKSMGDNAQFLTDCSILPEYFSMPLTCLGTTMELVVGVCLLFHKHYRGATLWGTVMTGVFFLLYSQAWVRGLSLSCACTGNTQEVTNYPMDTGLRLILLGSMLLLVWDSRRNASGRRKKAPKFDFSDA